MKRISSIVLCVVASFVTAGTGMAQTYSVEAKVPFNFAVGRTSLPAGTYTIYRMSPDEIAIQNESTGRVMALSLIQPENSSAVEPGKLVFHKYGESYFLSEIVCPAAATTASLPTSKQEKRAQARQQEEMAGGYGVVLLALNR